jgi:predicted TIM-barrel fold metal-dependent hydrolase
MNDSQYRIVSADSHFVEPPDLFTSRLDARLRDRGPRTEFGALGAGFEGEFWIVPESASATPRAVATFFGAGMSMDEVKDVNRRGFAAAPDFVFDPAARLQAQDRDGVSSEVLYSSCGLMLFGIEDGELRRASFRAFNDWAAEYCGYDPKRLLGCALIDVDDVEAGARELERAVGMGLHAGMITGSPLDGQPYSGIGYDLLWATAQDLDVPLSLHVSTGRSRHVEPVPFVGPVTHALYEVQASLAHLVIGGVFERFPRLKVILAEIDVSWIPHFLYRADHFFTRFRDRTGFSLLPSGYVRRNVWATFQDEGETIPFAAALFGVDRLLWASDFPHMNSTYPDTREFVADNFRGMAAGDVQRIVGGNAVEVYGLV